MRDYRFRGKSIEPLVGDDQWVYGFGVHVAELSDGGKEYWMYSENGALQVDPETVGQYTGLPDRYGKEIYKGDICRDSLGWVFVVEWDNDGSRFIGRHSQPRGDTYICYVGREPAVEVIGNIYDNPELLGEVRE